MSIKGIAAASAMLVAALASGNAIAQAQPAALATETVPTFLGIDLPLRPGERVIPVGKNGCGIVSYVPDPGSFDGLAARWSKAEWDGACRFGLVHGPGVLVSAEGIVQAQMWLYGQQIQPRLEVFARGTLAIEHLYRAASAGAPVPENFTLILTPAELGSTGRNPRTDKITDIPPKWQGGTIIRKWINPQGTAMTATVRPEPAQYYCNPAGAGANLQNRSLLRAEFAGVLKRACAIKDNSSGFLLIRSERADGQPTEQVVWAKECPRGKVADGSRVCAGLVLEALQPDAKALTAALAEDAAARTALIKERFARFAPLEQALEARAAAGGTSRGTAP